MLTKGCVATGAGCGKEKEADLLQQDGTRRDKSPRRASVWRFFFSSATDPTRRPRWAGNLLGIGAAAKNP